MQCTRLLCPMLMLPLSSAFLLAIFDLCLRFVDGLVTLCFSSSTNWSWQGIGQGRIKGDEVCKKMCVRMCSIVMLMVFVYFFANPPTTALTSSLSVDNIFVTADSPFFARARVTRLGADSSTASDFASVSTTSSVPIASL